MGFLDLIVSESSDKSFEYSNEQLPQTMWKTIFEQSPIGFALWNQELKSVRINRAFSEMNGFSAETYLSKIEREDFKMISDETILIMREVISSGKPLIGSEIDSNIANVSDVRRTWLASYHPILENDKVEGILASYEDLTDRKLIEAENLRVLEELRYRDARFDSLVLATATTYWSTDSEGEIIDDVPMWNKLTGQTTSQMQKLGWQDVIHPDDVEETTKKWQTAVKKKTLYETEFRLQMKTGEYRYFVSRALPVIDENGNVREWVGVNVDIENQKQTDRKLQEVAIQREELLGREQHARQGAEEADHLKDDFLATLSHELRTPLTATLGWVKMLRAGQVNPENIAHALETIERNTEVQKQLIEDLIDVSRIVSGNIRLEMQPISLGNMLKSAINAISQAAIIKNIKVIDDVLLNSNLVSADSQRIQQILSNLLTNAIKFTPIGGQVNVGLRERNNNLEVSIKDTGMGINAAILPKIFERFRQVDSTKTRRYGGLGLGLAIVRHLAQAHGGSVEATSEGEGKGSTFIFRLPILLNSSEPIKHVKIETTKSPSGKLDEMKQLCGLQLLIVDDVEDNRDLLNTLLSYYGADVTLASSAAEGMKLLSQLHPDLLISDIGMPDEDGYQFIKKIRALSKENGGNIPAIALTAFAKIEDREMALAAGFQRHVTKPINPTEFVKIVADLASETIL